MLGLNSIVEPGICEETFKNRLFHVIVNACNDAIRSDRTTLTNLLDQQGHKDMADILRRL